MVKKYAYGHDFGNAEIGGVLTKSSNQVLTRSIPTAFAKIDTNAMKGLGVEMAESLIIQMDGETTSYGVGPVALAQSKDPWTGRGYIQRYATSYSLRGLLAVSGSLITDKEYELEVVTGLPAETYMKNQGLRKEIKAALQGTHKFTLDQGKTWRVAHVSVATVIMEGAGALIAYGGKDGSPQGAGVIDVGGRTTDLYVARGQQPRIEYCKGKPIGVVSVMEMLKQGFEATYDFPLEDLDARNILHAWAAPGRKKKYPPLSIFGKPVEAEVLDRLMNEATMQTAEELEAFVSGAWRQNDSSSKIAAQFSPVLMIGGGTYYFYERLKKSIPHLIRPEDDPVYANARGYAKMAEKYMAKKATETSSAQAQA
ncbi:ParM/StbA family protein [Ktedonobacter racemifer]|nr:ParM/StbA family protein [Ktedonobacter racemifer]